MFTLTVLNLQILTPVSSPLGGGQKVRIVITTCKGTRWSRPSQSEGPGQLVRTGVPLTLEPPV